MSDGTEVNGRGWLRDRDRLTLGEITTHNWRSWTSSGCSTPSATTRSASQCPSSAAEQTSIRSSSGIGFSEMAGGEPARRRKTGRLPILCPRFCPASERHEISKAYLVSVTENQCARIRTRLQR